MTNTKRWTAIVRITGAALVAFGATLGCSDVPPPGVDDWEQVTSPIRGGSLVASNVAPFNSVYRLQAPAGGCTATKIGNRRFLTAAHCLPGATVGGTVTLTNSLNGLGATNFTLTFVAIHPSWVYRSTPDYYDLGVFDVSADTPGIPVIPLRAEFVPDPTSLTVVGYGCDPASTNGGKKQTAVFVSDGTSPSQPDVDIHNVVNRDASVFLCLGDSGSPWLIQSPPGTWKIGAVSSRGSASRSLGTRNGSVARWVAAPAINVFAHAESGNFFNGNSRLCMGIAGASTAPDVPAKQFYCDSRNLPNDNQSWTLLGLGAGKFAFINRNSNLCLGVAGGSPDDGVALKQFGCAATQFNNQAWSFVQTSGDFYQIRNAASGKCIGVGGGSLDPDVGLAQFTCSGLGTVNNQAWIFTR